MVTMSRSYCQGDGGGDCGESQVDEEQNLIVEDEEASVQLRAAALERSDRIQRFKDMILRDEVPPLESSEIDVECWQP